MEPTLGSGVFCCSKGNEAPGRALPEERLQSYVNRGKVAQVVRAHVLDT